MFRTRNLSLRTMAAAAVCATVVSTAGWAAPASAASCPSLRPATPPRGSLLNIGDVAIGVFHLADGNCTHGTYDAVLPVGENTRDYFGWNEVAGAYIGPGYDAATLLPGEYNFHYFGTDSIVVDPWKYGGNWQITAYRVRE